VTYDETLFAGAAPYYSLYRAPYPPELIADIVAIFALDGTGRLLDLGCGPGTLTFPLAPHFAEIVAVDPDAEMIEEARRLDTEGRVEWRVMRGEDISPEMGTFRVVSAGSSIHWMDRDLVLARAAEMVEPGGGVALAGGGTPWLEGAEDWHGVVTRLIQRYLGEGRRAGRGFSKPSAERFEGTLERLDWRIELARGYEQPLEWTADTIVGHLWSTSFANRALLGGRADDFERELRAELRTLRPNDRFSETGVFGLVCGRPPL
jgi:SAM-dependent methyltransferase